MTNKVSIKNVKVGKIGNKVNPSYYVGLPKKEFREERLDANKLYDLEIYESEVQEKPVEEQKENVKNEELKE